MGKALADVHVLRRQVLAEYVFDGGIGDFFNHEDETYDELY